MVTTQSSATADQARLLRLATWASVGTALVLILAKLIAWGLTGSISVLASLVDSVMDLGASVLNLLAVHWSLRPPDREHRFGHGNAQALAALGQSALIVGTALFLGAEAIGRLLQPVPLAATGVGVVVILFAIVATLALLAFQRHVIRRTGSPAIRADSLHYATDLATNLATLLALMLVGLGWAKADPLIGLGIAGWVLVSALRLGWEAVDLLMDRELPDADRARILSVASAVPLVHGVHGLRTRRSGQRAIIQLHLVLDDGLTLASAHRVALAVEANIRALYPDADITIHQDPSSLGAEPGEAMEP